MSSVRKAAVASRSGAERMVTLVAFSTTRTPVRLAVTVTARPRRPAAARFEERLDAGVPIGAGHSSCEPEIRWRKLSPLPDSAEIWEKTKSPRSSVTCVADNGTAAEDHFRANNRGAGLIGDDAGDLTGLAILSTATSGAPSNPEQGDHQKQSELCRMIVTKRRQTATRPSRLGTKLLPRKIAWIIHTHRVYMPGLAQSAAHIELSLSAKPNWKYHASVCQSDFNIPWHSDSQIAYKLQHVFILLTLEPRRRSSCQIYILSIDLHNIPWHADCPSIRACVNLAGLPAIQVTRALRTCHFANCGLLCSDRYGTRCLPRFG